MVTTKDKYALNRSPDDQHMITVSRNGKIKTESKNPKTWGRLERREKGPG